MMKRILTIILLISVSCLSAYSQSIVLTAQEQKSILSAISETSKNITTLTCDFVQEKTSTMISEKAISKGTMNYKTNHCLRWEYKSPKASTLIVNNDDIALKNEKGTNETINTRMFKELTNIIISTIDGSGLSDCKNFATTVSSNTTKSIYNVTLTPVNKRIAAVYSNIYLTISAQTKLAKQITLQEKNGDTMKITFSNHTINQPISNKLFITK